MVDSYADFTVSMKHFGREVTKQDIMTFFHKDGIVVKEICFISKNSKTRKYLKKLDKLDRQVIILKETISRFESKVLDENNKLDTKLVRRSIKMISLLNEKLIDKQTKRQSTFVNINLIYENQMKGNQPFSPADIAYITFDTLEHKDLALKKYSSKKSILSKLCCCFCICSRQRPKGMSGIQLDTAKQPFDIKWENSAVSSCQIWFRFSLVSMFNVLLFLVFIILIIISQLIKINLRSESDLEDTDVSLFKVPTYIMSRIISLFFVGILFILQKIFNAFQPLLIKFERLRFKSREMVSLNNKYFWSSIIKYLLFLFINETLFAFSEDDDRSIGLIFLTNSSIDTSSSVLLSFLVLKPLFEILNLRKIKHKIMQMRVRSKNILLMKQQQLNVAMQYYSVDLNVQYTHINIAWFICIGISPVLPYAPLVALVHFGLIYWIKKMYYLGGSTIHKDVDSKILMRSLHNLMYSCPYFLLGSYHFNSLFKLQVSESYKQRSSSFNERMVYFIGSLVFILLIQIPTKPIWACIFRVKRTEKQARYFTNSQQLKSYNYYNPHIILEKDIQIANKEDHLARK